MDILLSLAMMTVFFVVFVITMERSRRYKWLVTPAVFYATLLFFVVLFGNMMLVDYFASYAAFFKLVKEIIYIPPLFVYFILYAVCFFFLLVRSDADSR